MDETPTIERANDARENVPTGYEPLPLTVSEWMAEPRTLATMVENIERVNAFEDAAPEQQALDLFEFPNLPSAEDVKRKKGLVYRMLQNYRARLFQAGVNPLDMMCRLAMMAFEAGDYERAFDLWERIAPYMHSKLAQVASVPHVPGGGGQGGTLQVQWMPNDD